jgi:hypothetical protein
MRYKTKFLAAASVTALQIEPRDNDFNGERPSDHGVPRLMIGVSQRRMQPIIDIRIDQEGRDGDRGHAAR